MRLRRGQALSSDTHAGFCCARAVITRGHWHSDGDGVPFGATRLRFAMLPSVQVL